MSEIERIVNNFYDMLIDYGYCDEEDYEEDFDDMCEDFSGIKRDYPRLYNLIKDISDR